MKKQNTFLSIIGVTLVCASATLADNWIRDAASDCAIWNPNPTEHETIVWHGPIEDGKASGYGIATWRVQGKQTEHAEGKWSEGRLDGHAIWKHVSGACYEGEWKAGRKDGCGIYTWPNGMTFVGEYISDRRSIGRVFLPDGTPRKAMAAAAARELGYKAEDAAILARKAATRARIETPLPQESTPKAKPVEPEAKEHKGAQEKAKPPCKPTLEGEQSQACAKTEVADEDPSAK